MKRQSQSPSPKKKANAPTTANAPKTADSSTTTSKAADPDIPVVTRGMDLSRWDRRDIADLILGQPDQTDHKMWDLLVEQIGWKRFAVAQATLRAGFKKPGDVDAWDNYVAQYFQSRGESFAVYVEACTAINAPTPRVGVSKKAAEKTSASNQVTTVTKRGIMQPAPPPDPTPVESAQEPLTPEESSDEATASSVEDQPATITEAEHVREVVELRSHYYATVRELYATTNLPGYEKDLGVAVADALGPYEQSLYDQGRMKPLPPQQIVEEIVEFLLQEIGPADAPVASAERSATLKKQLAKGLGSIYGRQPSPDDHDALWTAIWEGAGTLRDELVAYQTLLDQIVGESRTQMATMDEAMRKQVIALVSGESAVHPLQGLNPACQELAELVREYLVDLRDPGTIVWSEALDKDGFVVHYDDGTTNIDAMVASQDEPDPNFKQGYEYQIAQTMKAWSEYRLVRVEKDFGDREHRVDSLEWLKSWPAGDRLVERYREYKSLSFTNLPSEAYMKKFENQLAYYSKLTNEHEGRDLEYVFKSRVPPWADALLRKCSASFHGSLLVTYSENGERVTKRVEPDPKQILANLYSFARPGSNSAEQAPTKTLQWKNTPKLFSG
ncbi:hypothetical protein J5X84_19870 [Streptosporangiaceae bacterium NEAU-GS5]|nr:hypothetical protein [Streptosporangiaceae bacterium NEAU-GS5]